MSTTPDGDADRTTVALSRESQWVVHHVALDELLGEDADGPRWARSVVERIETDALAVTRTEGRRLRERLREYVADDAPERDVRSARRALETLDATLAE
jgi:hypothetical protein